MKKASGDSEGVNVQVLLRCRCAHQLLLFGHADDKRRLTLVPELMQCGVRAGHSMDRSGRAKAHKLCLATMSDGRSLCIITWPESKLGARSSSTG